MKTGGTLQKVERVGNSGRWQKGMTTAEYLFGERRIGQRTLAVLVLPVPVGLVWELAELPFACLVPPVVMVVVVVVLLR